MFVPEETTGAENQKETAQERLEARLNRIEQEVLKENRWWRGGLIAALVLVALAIFAAGHHHHHERMAMAAGWAASEGMPYGGYGPYPPPPHPGFGWGGPCGREPGYGWGPGPWGGEPKQWGGPGPQAPQGPSPH
jgi:hypothetical protein